MEDIDLLDEETLYQSDEEQFFLFYISQQVYALEALYVSEIVEYQTYTKVPNLSPFILGVTNIRGHIIGVLDFAQRCGLDKNELTHKSSFVVLKYKEQDIALLIDEIYEVDGFSEEMRQASPEFGTAIESRFINNIVTYRDKNIFLLNIEELLNMQELSTEVLTNG